MSPHFPCIWRQQSCSMGVIGVAAQAKTGTIMTSMTRTATKLVKRRTNSSIFLCLFGNSRSVPRSSVSRVGALFQRLCGCGEFRGDEVDEVVACVSRRSSEEEGLLREDA